jgi:hypothetical protein
MKSNSLPALARIISEVLESVQPAMLTRSQKYNGIITDGPFIETKERIGVTGMSEKNDHRVSLRHAHR